MRYTNECKHGLWTVTKGSILYLSISPTYTIKEMRSSKPHGREANKNKNVVLRNPLASQVALSMQEMTETQVRSLVGKIPWSRKQQPALVILSGKFHEQRSMVGYSSWGHKESDTTEPLHFPFLSQILSHVGSCRGCMLDHVINTLKVFSDKRIKRKNRRKV